MLEKFKLIVVLLITTEFSSAQIRIQNLSLIQPDSTVAYIGIANKLRVLGWAGFSHLTILVNGTSYPVDKNGKAEILPFSAGLNRLQLIRNNHQLLSEYIRVSVLCRAKTRLGPYSDTTVPIAGIRFNNRLSIFHPGCLVKLNYLIFSFRLTIYDKDGVEKGDYAIKGDLIPPDIMKLVEELGSGDRLHFQPREVAGPDDGRYLPTDIVIR